MTYMQFRNSEEESFYSNVFEVLKEFIQNSECTSKDRSLSTFLQKCKVLVFLPVIPRARFLIHKCTESFPRLNSVSIGESIFRRVAVVYFKLQHPAPAILAQQQKKQRNKCHKTEIKVFEMSSSSPRNDPKKPDKAIYVPKHRRDVNNKDFQKKKTEIPCEPVSAQSNCRNATEKKNKAEFNRTDKTEVENLKLNFLQTKNSLEKEIEATKQVEEAAQLISKKILRGVFEVLPPKLSRLRNLQNNRQVAHIQLEERLLPGMAMNFVNLAIENALELIKSIHKYDNRVPNVRQEEGFLKCYEENSLILVKEEKQSGSVDGISIECTTSDKLKDNSAIDVKKSITLVNDTSNKSTENNDNSNKIIETNQREKEITNMPTKKNGKSTKGSKNKINKDPSKNLSCKVLKDEKPSFKYGSKMKKTKKNKNHVEKPVDTVEKVSTKLIETKPIIEETAIDGAAIENGDGESDNWDANWTEDGECLNNEMLQELSSLTGMENIEVEKAEGIDYLSFTPTKHIELDAGEFGHILELFDFSPVLKTQEIFSALSSAGIKDINLTWVDDTHALAVFASQAAAHTAMKQYIPVLQMRQVINGTRESKAKARDFKESLLPYKRRPATTGMVARNLIAGALGIRTKVPMEQRRKERELLKEAKEERRLKKKQKSDVWDNSD